MKIDKSITIVREYIEEKLGGNVEVSKNTETKTVVFDWTKNSKTIFADHFSKAYSYAELEMILEPSILGKNFVENYKNPKVEVKKPTKGKSQKKVVEESKEIEKSVKVETKPEEAKPE